MGQKLEDQSLKVGLIQQSCSSKKKENLSQAVGLIREAAAKGARVICLQEIFSTPYFCTVEDPDLFDLAEPAGGETISAISSVAEETETVIIVPFFEKRAPGVYHNSAAVIDADGSCLGIYRKMHIPDDPLYYEKFYFTPGDEPGFKVFDTRYAKVGVLICWDQWYPEAARLTALQGAEIIFYPTAIGWHPAEKEEHGQAQLEAWLTIQRSHAIANGVFVASVNRVGHELTPGTEGLEFFGNSFIADPFGRVLASASSDKEEILLADCSKPDIEDTRRNWPFFRDRRIDAYSKLTSRFDD